MEAIAGQCVIKVAISGSLPFNGKYNIILYFDWLWSNVAVLVVIEWQVAIDVNFY